MEGRRSEGYTEIAEGGGRSFSFFFIVLFLWFRFGGVGPQEAQKAQKLGFQGSASFALFVAKVGWSRTWETNFNAKAQRGGETVG